MVHMVFSLIGKSHMLITISFSLRVFAQEPLSTSTAFSLSHDSLREQRFLEFAKFPEKSTQGECEVRWGKKAIRVSSLLRYSRSANRLPVISATYLDRMTFIQMNLGNFLVIIQLVGLATSNLHEPQM